jgi:FtsH-binding integral membrane protein
MARFFGNTKAVAGNVYQMSGTDRLTFVRKVYAYFTFSLLITAAGGYVGYKFVLSKIVTGGFISWPAFIGVLVLQFVALAVTFWLRKKDPINKVMLAVYSFLSGLTLGPILMIAAYVSVARGGGAANLILQAFVITAIVFVGLTAYVFTSKKDFSAWRGGLFLLLLVGIGMGIMGMIFGFSQGMLLIYSGAMALIFGGFILYDTSMIMKYYSTDEYIAGAIELQIDFVGLFIQILRILIILSGSSRD